MSKKIILITTVLMITCASSVFADTPNQDAIANACKPYLQQYTPNMNPNSLPANAQQALVACKQNGSCATETLSNPQTGITNCNVKLNALQPIPQIPQTMMTQSPPSQKVIQQPPAHPFTIGSPEAAPAQTVPQAAPAQEMNTEEPPAQNNTQPSKKQAPQNSINWF